ncbi:MAG: valine--tRNA ligase [Ignisphaera sp.]|nr:valine--tRNA ligase [Ignisphaera sp.]MDW8085234.1 valine--tRNA ligase [Ignisphaera sp.]
MLDQKFKPRIENTRWKPEFEESLVKLWEKEGLFRFSYINRKPTLIIDTPPPYISGKPHVGQAAHYVQIDMVARAYRMLGYNVLVPFYADRNGLPVEVFVERVYGVNPHEVAKTVEGREKFLQLCKNHLDEIEKEFIKVWRKLGCTFEYWQEGTDSEKYRKITQSTFIEMWRKGYIYEAERPVIWCPRCRTSLAEAEVEYKKERAELYHISFQTFDGELITIATTRPELLGACVAVAYHPDDVRYRHLRGRKIIVPLYGYIVDAIEHKSVDPLFGTGLMMICSYGDQADVRVIRELGLKTRLIVKDDGTINDGMNILVDLKVREARSRIVDLLMNRGLLVKIDKVERNVPICWRCGTPIEFIHTREFFLKQLEYKDALKEVIKNSKFIPEEHRRKLLDWIDSITMDWPISKTRYYATEIPVWRCKLCGQILVPEPKRYYRPWKETPPWNSCPNCGASREHLVGETKVFDTWFDSSISVLYAAGASRYQHIFELYISNRAEALRPQGYEIIRTWLYYSLLRIYQLFGKCAFNHIRINGMGLDEKGEAMHKSKGNVVYPEPYVEKYGADAFRFWSAAAAKLGSDYRFSEQLLRTGALFVTKLLNIARFISAVPFIKDVDATNLYPLDLAILNRMNDIIEDVRKSYEEMDFYRPIHILYHFVWDEVADNYIEMVKSRIYDVEGIFSENERRSAWFTLHTLLKNTLLLLAPILPFITDYIWRKTYGENSIHFETLPKQLDVPKTELKELLPYLYNLNSLIWKYKKTINIKLTQELEAVLYIPEKLSVFVKDIKYLHRVREIRFGKPDVQNYADLGNNVFLVPFKTDDLR